MRSHNNTHSSFSLCQRSDESKSFNLKFVECNRNSDLKKDRDELQITTILLNAYVNSKVVIIISYNCMQL